MSFKRNGTPRNGPVGSSRETAAARASSKSGVITALMAGFTRSIRAMAASTSSSGVSSRRRTSSACAVASIVDNSLTSRAIRVPRFNVWSLDDSRANRAATARRRDGASGVPNIKTARDLIAVHLNRQRDYLIIVRYMVRSSLESAEDSFALLRASYCGRLQLVSRRSAVNRGSSRAGFSANPSHIILKERIVARNAAPIVAEFVNRYISFISSLSPSFAGGRHRLP